MIFVTVGTHEQQFNRLIEFIDKMKENGKIEDEVIMQVGYSTYEPKYCKWDRLIPYNQMEYNVENARIVITHGGPASFIMPLRMGKIPVVVPRQYDFDEHVNNHQVDFAKEVSERMHTIIPVVNIEELENVIVNYNQIVGDMNHNISSNNAVFNKELERIVESLF